MKTSPTPRRTPRPRRSSSAAKAAKIHSFIESLPDGYNTLLTDDGINISKRLALLPWRGQCCQSSMLILDEATSNVDCAIEIKIQGAMRRLMKGRTCFVIAHRLSTVQNADVILVVRDGNVIEQGSHEQTDGRRGILQRAL